MRKCINIILVLLLFISCRSSDNVMYGVWSSDNVSITLSADSLFIYDSLSGEEDKFGIVSIELCDSGSVLECEDIFGYHECIRVNCIGNQLAICYLDYDPLHVYLFNIVKKEKS